MRWNSVLVWAINLIGVTLVVVNVCSASAPDVCGAAYDSRRSDAGQSTVSAISDGSIYSIELHANGETLIRGTSGATFPSNLVSILFKPRGPHNRGVFREYLRGDDG